MDKAYSADSVKGVKDGLRKDHQFRDNQINEEGIDEALQNCKGSVQSAIVYYVEQHFKGVLGYSRDADTSDDDSSDDEYYQPTKRRRTGPANKYAPTKSTNKRFTRNNEPSTTNNKPSSASSGSGYQQLEGSRKRKPKEGKYLPSCCLINMI